MSSTEAEAVKLNSNAYLAMRVAFFNEIDNFCLDNNLSAKNIVTGMSLDQELVIIIITLFWLWRVLSTKRYKAAIESLKGLRIT